MVDERLDEKYENWMAARRNAGLCWIVRLRPGWIIKLLDGSVKHFQVFKCSPQTMEVSVVLSLVGLAKLKLEPQLHGRDETTEMDRGRPHCMQSLCRMRPVASVTSQFRRRDAMQVTGIGGAEQKKLCDLSGRFIESCDWLRPSQSNFLVWTEQVDVTR